MLISVCSSQHITGFDGTKEFLMAEWYKDAFDEYYTEVYWHRDEEEARKFAAFLNNRIPLRGLRVLDVCCGEGRHMRALRDVGAICFGLDLSGALLGKLKGKAPSDTPLIARGDMRSLPFKRECFDLCINMFTSLGYFEERRDELQVLQEVSRILKPGGHFVLDYMNSHWVRSNLEPRTVRARGELIIEETRRLLPERRILEKRTVIRSASTPSVEVRDYIERLALFDRPVLEQMLGDTGFDIVSLHGDYEGGPFQEKSSTRLLIVSRKD